MDDGARRGQSDQRRWSVLPSLGSGNIRFLRLALQESSTRRSSEEILHRTFANLSGRRARGLGGLPYIRAKLKIRLLRLVDLRGPQGSVSLSHRSPWGLSSLLAQGRVTTAVAASLPGSARPYEKLAGNRGWRLPPPTPCLCPSHAGAVALFVLSNIAMYVEPGGADRSVSRFSRARRRSGRLHDLQPLSPTSVPVHALHHAAGHGAGYTFRGLTYVRGRLRFRCEARGPAARSCCSPWGIIAASGLGMKRMKSTRGPVIYNQPISRWRQAWFGKWPRRGLKGHKLAELRRRSDNRGNTNFGVLGDAGRFTTHDPPGHFSWGH